MPVTQNRPALDRTVQQMANIPMGAVLAGQIASFSAAGAMPGDDDLAVCDASSGLFALTLPGVADALVGKPYWVAEVEGTNGVTVTADGAGLIAGSATYALPAGGSVCLVATASDAQADAVTWEILSEPVSAGGGLLAANNLTDVADANVSRASLDAGRMMLSIPRINVIGAAAQVYRYVHSGPDATVVQLDCAITGTLDIDGSITASIDGTPITTGVITLTAAASVAGSIFSATPSALNILTAGATLELTVGGGDTAAEFADMSVQLTY